MLISLSLGWFALGAGVALDWVGGGVAAAGISQAPQAATAAAPQGYSAPSPGIYTFLDWRHTDPAQYPFVVGGHQVFTWREIEDRTPGVYNWSKVDAWLAAEAALGKPTVLGFNSYDGACCGGEWLPSWFKQQHPDGYVVCQGVIIPKYWSTAYQQAWRNFVQAAAARYDNDPRLAWMETSTGIYGETMPAEPQFHDCLKQNGLTSQLWVETVNKLNDIYLGAWRNKPLFVQYAPFYLDRKERRDLTDYVGSKGLGMKHNKLLPDHDDQVIDDPTYYYYRAGQYDPMFTFMGRVPSAWEVYRDFLPTETDTYWAMLNGLNKHSAYFLVNYSLVSSASALEKRVFDMANRYAGRSLEDTPSVWIALRETEATWYPQRGNFDFWLYQHDDVPGGKTAPVWQVTTDPRGRYARRTDGTAGNPYMYFDVDDGYAFALGGTHAVSVTITYLDKGVDTWQLQYDAVDNPYAVAFTVRKENTGQWRTISTLLTDVHFGNRQTGGSNHPGHDFRIWDGGDGNDTFHMVDVTRVALGQTYSVTLQPDGVTYNGVIDTYIDSWSPDANTGDYARVSVRPEDVWAGLVRFDLSGQPPAGLGAGNAVIQEAYLDLFVRTRSNDSNWVQTGVYALRRPWREGEATWRRAANAGAWTVAGANGIGTDRTGTLLDQRRLDKVGVWQRFDITAAMAEWIGGAQENYGVVIRGIGGSGGQVSYDFASSEVADAAIRPRLVYTYVVAAPTPTPSPTRIATPTPTPTATQNPPRQVTAKYAPAPPLVDGDLVDWPLDAGVLLDRNTAETIHVRGTPEPADSSLRAWAAWDANTLYLAARVYDDVVVSDSIDAWKDDSIEFAIDSAQDGRFDGPDDHQITITADGRVLDWGVTELPAVLRAAAETVDGYIVEMAIPLSALQPPAWHSGHVAGFNIGLHDDDEDGGDWDTYMIWEGASTNRDAANFGRLLLSGDAWPTPTPGGPTPTATPTTTPSSTPTPTATASATPLATAPPTTTGTPTALATPDLSPTAAATPTATAAPGSGAIAGVVYDDRNGSGGYDEGDAGVAGAWVYVWRSGTRVAEMSTGPDGRFVFADLSPSVYLLQASDPPGYAVTQRQQYVAVNSGMTITHDFIVVPGGAPAYRTFLPLLAATGG